MSQKISACLIVRDESANLAACLESIRPHVSELVIVDTGSTDNTPEIAQKYADKFAVFTDCNDPATGQIDDFSLARDKSFELAENDWVYWADGDDVVENAQNLKQLVAQAHGQSDSFAYLLPYNYTFDQAGNCTCVHWRERLVYPRKNWRWQTPVHEVLLPRFPGVGTFNHGQSDLVRNIHRRQFTNKPVDPRRNLRILTKYIKRTGEGDVRAWYYLGLEHSYVGEYGAALRILRRYVQMSGDWLSNKTGWVDEKCLAFLQIAKIHTIQGDHPSAIEWATKASHVKGWQEPYFAICKAYYQLAMDGVDENYNWGRCAYFGKIGINVPESQTLLFVNPLDKFEVHKFLSIALAKLGKVNEAIESCEMGLAGMAGEPVMVANLREFQKSVSIQRAVEAVGDVLAKGGIDEARAILCREVLMGRYQVQVEAPALPEVAGDRTRALDIVLFTGPALEQWSPETIAEKGMGGSETMAWEIAKRLAKLGHRVRHYGDCSAEMARTYEGVEWRDFKAGLPTTCDVLISSRRPELFDSPIQARAKILWIHDVHCSGALTPDRLSKITRVLALSDWHRGFLQQSYPFLPAEKISVMRNGIDLGRFSENDIARDPTRAVYSSSPDRGLLTAIECWPRIRSKVPGAELHIYYGFDNWEKTIELTGDKAQLTSIKQLRDIIEATEGVFMHGRVNQLELAREMLKAGVWTNATWFTETSCITAMEAQAAGLFIVTSPIAALNETCSPLGTAMIEGDWRSEDYKRAFTKAVVEAMTCDDEFRGATREAIQAQASRFSLDARASEWNEMLRELVFGKDEMPVFKEWTG